MLIFLEVSEMGFINITQRETKEFGRVMEIVNKIEIVWIILMVIIITLFPLILKFKYG